MPERETERLAALRHYRLEITGREPEFDRIARQVTDLFEVPIGLVTLVLDDNQRFLGACGIEISGMPRDIAFCSYALLGQTVLVVPDARADPRFARNPLVTGPPGIRFYAGAPLILAPGLVAGSLCAIGSEPKEFGEKERRQLFALAETVMDLIRHRLGTLIARDAEKQAAAISCQHAEILDAMPAAVAVYDEDGLLIRTNRHFQTTFQLDGPKLVHPGMSPGDVWKRLRAQGHRLLPRAAGQARLRGGSEERRRARSEPFEMRLADGRTLLGLEVRTASGLVISAQTDISEMKSREATIAAQEGLLRATLETIGQGVLVLDETSALALSNERFFEIMRTPPALRAPGTPLDMLLRDWFTNHETARGPAAAAAALSSEAIRQRSSARREIAADDGRVIDYRREPMPDGRTLITVADMTQQRRLERLLRATLETIEHGVAVVEPDLTVALFNDRFFDLTGTPPELRCEGTPIEALMRAWFTERGPSDDDAEALIGARLDAMRRRENETFETKLRDGRQVLFTRAAMSDGRHLLVVTDITLRREAERMKDEFVATVSHELRTPLTSVSGSLGLLAAGAGGPLNEGGQRLLDIARKNSDRLVRLINDLLDMGKIEAGQLDFVFSDVLLTNALRAAADENRPYAERLGVSLELLLPDLADRVNVRADSHRLHQVLSNLLSNAAKFSPLGGRVLLTFELRPEGVARITVTDEGPGVPEAFRGRLFQRFAQADSTSKRRQEGTGLGLAIARVIVERHGGQIGFHEGPHGTGSVFHVDLPLQTAQASLPVLLCASAEAGTVGVQRALRDAELGMERVVTVAAALHRLRRIPPPRAVLLDTRMLHEGGLELIEALRTRKDLRGVRLLMLTLADKEAGDPLPAAVGGLLHLADWIAGQDAREALPMRLRASINAVPNGVLSGERPRILHVEDDPDLRQLVALSLGEGVETVPAPDLATARDLLGATDARFDLVILDIELPDGSGFELLPLLRLPDGMGAKVVIYSAHQLDAAATRGLEAVLAKSRVTIADLARTVHRLVHQEGGAMVT